MTQKKLVKHTFYPFNHKELIIDAGDLAVLKTRIGHLCGYCAIPKKQVPKRLQETYNAPGMQWLNIHGGLTWAKTEGEYCVYGFDCAHADDEKRKELTEPSYVLSLADDMKQALLAFFKQWPEYEKARLALAKKLAKIVDHANKTGTHKENIGFGAMLQTLGGIEL